MDPALWYIAHCVAVDEVTVAQVALSLRDDAGDCVITENRKISGCRQGASTILCLSPPNNKSDL